MKVIVDDWGVGMILPLGEIPEAAVRKFRLQWYDEIFLKVLAARFSGGGNGYFVLIMRVVRQVERERDHEKQMEIDAGYAWDEDTQVDMGHDEISLYVSDDDLGPGRKIELEAFSNRELELISLDFDMIGGVVLTGRAR